MRDDAWASCDPASRVIALTEEDRCRVGAGTGGGKKGPAKQEAAKEGGTEIDRSMKEMDINCKTGAKGEREGKARRRKKDVPIYEINVR